MEYKSGGGEWYDGGVWIEKETPKRITLILASDPFWEPNWKKIILQKDKNKTRGNPYEKDEEAGIITVYPDQCGIPHVFSPLDKTKCLR